MRHVLAFIVFSILLPGRVLATEGRVPAPDPDACVEQFARTQLPDDLKGLREGEASAVEVARLLLQEGRLPSYARDRAVHTRFQAHWDTRLFRTRLRQELADHPWHWRAFERAAKTTGQAAAEALASFLWKQGRMPHAEHDSALFRRFLNHRHDKDFLPFLKKKLHLRPDLWTLYEDSQTSPALLAARDLIRFVERHGRLNKDADDPAFAVRIRRHRDDPEFMQALRSSPQTLRLLANRQVSLLEKTAQYTILHIEKHGRLPTNRQERELYDRFVLYKYDPEFQDLLRKSPQAWAVFEPEAKIPEALLSSVSAKTIEYLLARESLPQQRVDKSLYNHYVRLKNHPDFIAKVREHEGARAIYDRVQPASVPAPRELIQVEAPSRELAKAASSPRKVAQKAATPATVLDGSPAGVAAKLDRYFASHNSLPMPMLEPALLREMEGMKSNLQFLTELYRYPKVWDRYRMVNRDQPLVVAVDTLGYFAKHRTLPQMDVDRILFQNFHAMKNKPQFRAVIQQDAELWALFNQSLRNS